MTTLPDTHAWAWWVTEDRRLSATPRRAIERSQTRGDRFASRVVMIGGPSREAIELIES
jgi:PIN domain nuclease of toxin-antitoxin system